MNVGKSASRPRVWKKNGKGETKLHQACIKGNLQLVTSLIHEEHPLNERDYAGWTALHEACNYGHTDVVRYLLDAGAKVNDPGDSKCNGITPLHDALYNGMLSVVELLITRGASINLRDKDGFTPQDTFNRWFSQRSDFDSETLDRLAWIKSQLQTTSLPEAMNGDEQFGLVVQAEPSPIAGFQVRNLPECEAELSPGVSGVQSLNKPSKRKRTASSPSTSPCHVSWDIESSDEELLPVFLLNMNSSSPSSEVAGQSSEPGSGQFAGHRAGGQAGAVVDNCTILSSESDEESTTDVMEDSASTEMLTPSPLAQSHPSPTPHQATSHPDLKEWTEGSQHSQPDPCTEEDKGWHSSDSRLRVRQGQDRETAVRESSSTQHTVTQLAPHCSQGEAQHMVLPANTSPGIRIRVCFRDITFLIGVPHSQSHTVGWLAGEASSRYQQSLGFLPLVRLTKSGAHLHSQDLILHVLQDNEKIRAEVMDWDLPPLSDRYTRCCQLMKLDRIPALVKVLKLQETSPNLDLSELDLGPKQLLPVLRALQQHSVTRELCLSSNRLCDRLLQDLRSTLITLPCLSHLDLASNNITATGLRGLCDSTLRPCHLGLQSLEKLDLSQNPLGDACSPSIAHLLNSCPRLSTLRLQACQLTPSFLSDSLREAIRGSSQLKRLCLSHNTLGLKGVKLLTLTLPQHILSHLDIASVVGTLSHTEFISHIAKYLLGDACALTHLNLSENGLTDDDIQVFASSLKSCPLLVSLDLSNNLSITDTGLEFLRSSLRGRNMDSLVLAGCSIENQQ